MCLSVGQFVCPSATVLIAYFFLTLRDSAFIICLCVPHDLSDGTMGFEHVTLTVTFDIPLENFNSAHNFLPYDIGLSYCTHVFFMTRPFRRYYKF